MLIARFFLAAEAYRRFFFFLTCVFFLHYNNKKQLLVGNSSLGAMYLEVYLMSRMDRTYIWTVRTV